MLLTFWRSDGGEVIVECYERCEMEYFHDMVPVLYSKVCTST